MFDANDPRLTAFALGELVGDEAAAVEAALERSPELRQSVAEIRETSALLESSLRTEPCPRLTAEQEQAIRAATLSPPTATPLATVTSRRTSRWATAAAALSLLIVAAGLWRPWHRSSDERGPQAAATDPSQTGPPSVGTPGSTPVLRPDERPALVDDSDSMGSGRVPTSSASRTGTIATDDGSLGSAGQSAGDHPSSSYLDGTSEASAVSKFVIDTWKENEPTRRPLETQLNESAVVNDRWKELVNETNRLRRPGVEPSGVKPAKSWRPAAATPNASRLMVGDEDDLPLRGLQANVVIDGFRARVVLDLYFYNDHPRPLEGAFQLRLPDEGSLYYFAFGETSYEYRPEADQLASKGFLKPELVRDAGWGPGDILKARQESWANVKEARIVARDKAAHAYGETVRRRVDPALVEWEGAGIFQARVFPLQPGKLHRIVVGYDVNLRPDGDDLVYRLELPTGLPECTVDVDLMPLAGGEAVVTPDTRPFGANGRAFYRIQAPQVPAVEVRLRKVGPMVLVGSDGQSGGYFATQCTPDLPDQLLPSSSHAIFLLDTSLSSKPEKLNLWLKMLQATLERNRDTIQQFALLFFNVEAHWWQNQFTPNTPEHVRKALDYVGTLSLEGATDLQLALRESTAPSWPMAGDYPRPDLFLLSDGAATWGQTSPHLLSDTLRAGTGGTLFAYRTGLMGSSTATLEHLARESGGAVFSIVDGQEIESAATAHRRRPWQLVQLNAAGGSDLLIAGRPRSIYPGQSLLLVGRGRPDGVVTLKLRRGDELLDLQVPLGRFVESQLTPRLYGQVAVAQLEQLGGNTAELATAYSRHFRVTGQACSLLMLESEADYERFAIRPEDDQLVVSTSSVADLLARKLAELATKLASPKAALQEALDNLEQAPGMQFRVPVALQLLLDQLPEQAFVVDIPRLVCRQRKANDVPREFLDTLANSDLDYESITAEANRRRQLLGPADALKALSSLVENNPGDPVLIRDVAFSAMEFGLSGQAYPLLQRIALTRPFEPQCYHTMAQCLAENGNADLAMIWYEVAMHSEWDARYTGFSEIARAEYAYLLHRIQEGQLSSLAAEFARARLAALVGEWTILMTDGRVLTGMKVGADAQEVRLRLGSGQEVRLPRSHIEEERPSQHAGRLLTDLMVTVMWNTDRTDVDLHVREPSGEVCNYQHPATRSGAQMTRDVTQGLGPEMYSLGSPPAGAYELLVHYFSSDANRTQARTKVYATVYQGLLGKHPRITRHTITLRGARDSSMITTLNVGDLE